MRPYGSDFYHYYNSVFAKATCLIFGLPELHTHYRTRALRNAFMDEGEKSGEKKTILEIGCGTGANLFEARKFFPIKEAVGYDADPSVLSAAQKVLDGTKLTNYKFILQCELPEEINFTPDIVLLIDVLEHIPSAPRATLISRLADLIPSGGKVFVSVPTTNYPSTFGDHMHRKVGHVMDGYTLETLESDMGGEFIRRSWKLSTGGLQAKLCKFYYREKLDRRGAANKIIKYILFALGKLLPTQSGVDTACSLFAVYERR
jgi:SAM-dependent methyltransferase